MTVLVNTGSTLVDLGTNAYRRAHDRVRALKGHARRHQCIDCRGKAKDWSLRPIEDCAGNLLVVPCRTQTGAVQPRWISDVPSDYVPRCRTDHRAADAAERRAFDALISDEPTPYEGGL